jgi:hypothetical protein
MWIFGERFLRISSSVRKLKESQIFSINPPHRNPFSDRTFGDLGNSEKQWNLFLFLSPENNVTVRSKRKLLEFLLSRGQM